MSRTPLLIGLLAFTVAVLTVGAAGHAVPAVADGTPASLPGDQPKEVVDVPNTTNYLSPNDRPNRREFVQASVDVGSAVDASATRLEGAHRTQTLDVQLAQESATTEDQLAAIERAVGGAETQRDRLIDSQNSLYRAYNNGSLTRQAFVRKLVRLEVRASEYRTYVDGLEERAEGEFGNDIPFSLETRLTSLQSGVAILPTPLSERVRDSVVGATGPLTVYTEGTEDALVLATVDGATFRRQATLLSEHQSDAPDEFEQSDQQAIAQVVERTTELYPWAYSNDQQFSRRVESAGPTTSIYRIEADHPQGSLSAYLSGSTTNVFHEIQTLDPTEVPVHKTVANETERLALTVTTTTETGPMRINLTTGVGERHNGTIRIDGQPVGTTGDDGLLWTVRPSGTFRLTAVGEDGAEASLERIRFVRSR